jgi:hypothetical protein
VARQRHPPLLHLVAGASTRRRLVAAQVLLKQVATGGAHEDEYRARGANGLKPAEPISRDGCVGCSLKWCRCIRPPCKGECDPRDCVLDAERLVSSVVERHLGGGTKRRDGKLQGGGGWLSLDDEDDLRAYLLTEVWEASVRFNGNGRLAGYCVWIAHKRVIDWLRHRFGSTRMKPRPELVPFDPQLHDIASTVDEYPSDENGRHLDRAALSPKALDQLALLELVIETDDGSVTSTARELGVANSLAVLHGEARIIGG